jgi:hypothetical protein
MPTKKIKKEIKKEIKKSYWLVFGNDHGNREDCNVFYSSLVLASNKENAIKAVCSDDSSDDSCSSDDNLEPRWGAIKMKLIEAD